MKRVYLTEPTHLELRDEPIPELQDHEVLVRIAFCGICTLEQRLYDGERKIYYPIVPGHEASGVVVSVGKRVMTSVSEGDHVVLDLVNRCHACPACLSGNSNLCENRFKKGQRVLGAFSEYIAVNPDQLQVVSKDLALEQAAFAEPLACCIRSIRKTKLSLGDTLFISGAGTMGLLHLKVALAMGIRTIVCDIDSTRLADAKAMGADAVFDATDPEALHLHIMSMTADRGVDACIITTPAVCAVQAGVRALASGGVLNIYTSYGDKPTLPVDMNTIHRNEFTITGSEGRSEHDFHTATKALAHKKVVVDDLISRIYPMEQADDAVKEALSGSSYRVLLRMGE
jgi:L-iditol 2-dehydrogenase